MKIKGQQHYLWILLDSQTRVVIVFRFSIVILPLHSLKSHTISQIHI
ncbi:MAG TPA: hypothetical protein IAB62_09560 [Candidatus Coprocola pullicola]|nr:hypothetical protein [Candidatus Coprocola pullicola]